jgi:putative membrane protein
MMMGGGLIGIVVLLVLLLLIGGGVAVAVWFFAQGSGGQSRRPEREPRREGRPLEILRERYARGEIDREEFNRMREELER